MNAPSSIINPAIVSSAASAACTVSVNPGANTLGSLHAESQMQRLRTRRALDSLKVRKARASERLRALFGCTSHGTLPDALMLALRLSTALVACAATFAFGAVGLTVGALGVFVACGIFARISAALASAGVLALGIHAAFESLASGEGIWGCWIFAALAVAFAAVAAMGPGRYSADAGMRRGIMRAVLRAERKEMEQRMSYKAYSRFHNI